MNVIIATFNRLDTLRDTFQSIKQSTVLPDMVSIIDQSTDPLLAEEIRKLTLEAAFSAEYYHLDFPSLTRARNYGMQQSEDEILVYMDDDVSVEPETFKYINEIMSDPNVALIAGRNLLSKNTSNKLGYIFGFKAKEKEQLGGYVTKAMYGRYPIEIKSEMPTEWAMGYFFVVRKSLIQTWNLKWDEKFVTYGYPEDLDFSFRYCKNAREKKMKCILHPEVAVFHRVSTEWRETSSTVTYMTVLNREYLTYKLGLTLDYRLMTRWANIGLFLLRLIRCDRPWDVFKAQFFCDLYRNDIKKGNLHTELYQK